MSGFKDFLVNRLLRERLGCRARWMIRYAWDLRISGPCPEALIPLTFRELTQEDLALSTLIDPHGLPEYDARMEQGQYAFGAFDRKNLAGFIWLNPRLVHETTTGIEFPLRPGECYSYHKWVDPAYRNLGVGSHLGWESNRFAVSKGFRSKTGLVDSNNHANRRSLAKTGGVASGYLIFLQLLGLRFTLRLPLAKLGTQRPHRLGSRRWGKSPGGTRGVP